MSDMHTLDRRSFLKAGGAALAGIALSGPGCFRSGGKRPNIVFILADDLGYGDVGCYGASAVPTPNIDRLAREGVRFTSGYCSAATCTPTRFSLLTGKYAFRQEGTGVAAPNATAIIQPGTVTLPSLLKQAGYATAVIGKWHLGLGEGEQPDWNGELKPGPLEIGFDRCFLLPTTNDRVPSVFIDDHRVKDLDPSDPLWVSRENLDGQPDGSELRDRLRMDWSDGHNYSVHNGIGRIWYFGGGHAARWRDEDLADTWVKESVQWMEEQKENPFFLYFASHDIHVPRMPHERFQGATSLGYRGDAIVELDWCVGQILAALDRLNLTGNTLVIFASDNGPVLDDGYKDGAVERLGDHTPAGPYRGGKYSVYEGGTHTPFITRWPGTIAPGESDVLVCTIDMAASLAGFTGEKLPAGSCPDSFDVMDALLGKPNAPGRDHLVEEGNGLALRDRDWKFIRFRDGRTELYNLTADPGETMNLIGTETDRAEAMRKRLEEIEKAGASRV